MPQIIEIPDIGQVEFPDGMSDADIARAIQNNYGPSQPASPLGFGAARQKAELEAAANDPSIMGSFLRNARENVGGGVGAMGLGLAGAKGGAAIGSPLGPIGIGAGTILGGLGGSVLGAFLGDEAQELVDPMTLDRQEAIARDMEANPIASWVGSNAPYMATMKLNPSGIATAFTRPTQAMGALERGAINAARTELALNAGMGAGLPIGTAIATGEPINPYEVLGNAALGTAFSAPNRLGRALGMNPTMTLDDARAAQAAVNPPPPPPATPAPIAPTPASQAPPITSQAPPMRGPMAPIAPAPPLVATGATRLAGEIAQQAGIDPLTLTPSGAGTTVTPNDVRSAASRLPATTMDSGGTIDVTPPRKPDPTLSDLIDTNIEWDGQAGRLVDDEGRPALLRADGALVELPFNYGTDRSLTELGVQPTFDRQQDRAVATRFFGETENESLQSVFGVIDNNTDDLLDVAELGVSLKRQKGKKSIPVHSTPEFAPQLRSITDEQILVAEDQIKQAIDLAQNNPNLSDETRTAVINKLSGDLENISAITAARDSGKYQRLPLPVSSAEVPTQRPAAPAASPAPAPAASRVLTNALPAEASAAPVSAKLTSGPEETGIAPVDPENAGTLPIVQGTLRPAAVDTQQAPQAPATKKELSPSARAKKPSGAERILREVNNNIGSFPGLSSLDGNRIKGLSQQVLMILGKKKKKITLTAKENNILAANVKGGEYDGWIKISDIDSMPGTPEGRKAAKEVLRSIYASHDDYSASGPDNVVQDKDADSLWSELRSELEDIAQGKTRAYDDDFNEMMARQEEEFLQKEGITPEAPKRPVSQMDIRNQDSRQLFDDDGGFALASENTQDGAKITAERNAKEEAERAQDEAQSRLFDEEEEDLGQMFSPRGDEISPDNMPYSKTDAPARTADIAGVEKAADEFFGGKRPENVKVVTEPNANWEARVNGDTIELNAAKVGPEGVRSALHEEVGHAAFRNEQDRAAFQKLYDALDDATRAKIDETVGKLYSDASPSLKAEEKLVKALRSILDRTPEGRAFWQKLLQIARRTWKTLTGQNATDPEMVAAALLRRGVGAVKKGSAGESRFSKVEGASKTKATNARELIDTVEGEIGTALKNLVESNPRLAKGLEEITVKDGSPSFDGKTVRVRETDNTNRTKAHEATHAILDTAIDSVPSFKKEVGSIINKALESIYRGAPNRRIVSEIVRIARSHYGTFGAKSNNTFSQYFSKNLDFIAKSVTVGGDLKVTDADMRMAYALTGEHEFLAAVMSDVDMRNLLKSITIPSEQKSLFRKFTDAIKSLFGKKVDAGPSDQLERVMREITKVINDPGYKPGPYERSYGRTMEADTAASDPAAAYRKALDAAKKEVADRADYRAQAKAVLDEIKKLPKDQQKPARIRMYAELDEARMIGKGKDAQFKVEMPKVVQELIATGKDVTEASVIDALVAKFPEQKGYIKKNFEKLVADMMFADEIAATGKDGEWGTYGDTMKEHLAEIASGVKDGSTLRHIKRGLSLFRHTYFNGIGGKMQALAEGKLTGKESAAASKFFKDIIGVRASQDGINFQGIDGVSESDLRRMNNERAKFDTELDSYFKEQGMSKEAQVAWLERVSDHVVNPARDAELAKEPKLKEAVDYFIKRRRERLAYLRDAGIDVGDAGERSLSRSINTEKVLTNPKEFVEKAKRAYMRKWAREIADLRKQQAIKEAEGKDTASIKDKIRELEKMDAQQAAEKYLYAITSDDNGISSDGNDITAASGGGQPSFLKKREFGPEADELLGKFYHRNIAAMDTAETLATVRAATKSRVLSAGGDAVGKWKKLRSELEAEGNQDMIPVAAQLVKDYLNLNGSNNETVRKFVGHLHTYTQLAYLSHATVASLGEPAMIGARTGRMVDTGRAYAQIAKGIVNSLRKAGPDEIRILNRELGIVADSFDGIMSGHALNEAFGGRGKGGNLVTNFHRLTGLSGWTNLTFDAATKVGKSFISSQVKLAKAGGSMSTLAKRELNELGMTAKDIDAVDAFINKLDKSSDQNSLILGDEPGADLYRKALVLFHQTGAALNPTRGTRAQKANNPVAGLFYQLQSFLYDFHQKFTLRQARRIKDAYRGAVEIDGATEKLSARERSQVAIDAAKAVAAIYGLQFGIQVLRENIFVDLERNERDKKKSQEEINMARMLGAASRTGILGPYDTLFNIISGARYQREPATVVLGPAVGGMSELFQSVVNLYGDRNSANTNTTERKLARTAYNTVATPALNALFAGMPAGPLSAALVQGFRHPLTRETAVQGMAGPIQKPKKGPMKTTTYY